MPRRRQASAFSRTRPTSGASDRRATAHVARHRPKAVRSERLRLALRLDRRHELGVDGVADEAVRPGAEQHLAGRGGLLEARGDVDRVARDECVARPGDDPARIDTDSHVDLDAVAELLGRAYGAQRIVLTDGRHAENRHDGVADELLESATVAFDRRPRDIEVGRHHDTERLRIERLAEGRRPRDVAEEHGDDLPLLPRRRDVEWCAARVAEAGPVAILRSAAGADHL